MRLLHKTCFSVAVATLSMLTWLGAGTPSAAAEAPQWMVTVTSSPTNIAPGGKGDYIVTAIDNGAPTDGSTITIADALPAGIKAVGIHGVDAGTFFKTFAPPFYNALSCELSTLTCTYGEVVTTGDMLDVVVEVEAEGPFPGGAPPTDTATVSGGGAPECGGAGQPACASASDATTISETPASFGLANVATAISSTQAGSHPNLTVGFTLNQSSEGNSAGFAKKIGVDLPPGLIGNPTATPRCVMSEVVADTCGADAAVGVASALVKAHPSEAEAAPAEFLVYDIKPYRNEPAAFAFDILGNVAVRIDTSVRGGGDYGIHVSVDGLSELEDLVASSVTLWGVPQRHNGPGRHESPFEAGFEPTPKGLDNTLIDAGFGIVSFGAHGNGAPSPQMREATSCSGAQEVRLSATSWPGPTGTSEAAMTSALESPTNCEGLLLKAALGLKASTNQPGAPAGYEVSLQVPQDEEAETLDSPDVRAAEVTLPEGTVLSPSAANGLDACSEAQFGLHTGVAGNCPSRSQIGKVKIATPLLTVPVEGHVYVGEPECSPCGPEDAAAGRMVPLLLEAEGAGVVVKLKGRTSIDQQTGRLTTAFDENPQLPFNELALALKGGQDAPLVNPSSCGGAVATAKLTPWSSLTATEVAAPAIPIEGCAAPGFAPSLEAGMTKSARGGSFSAFSATISRPDGQQALGSVTIHMPPGISGMLSKVPLCGEAQANGGSCPQASQIGTTTAVVGPGGEPYTIEGGKVYLTEKYGDGQFGLSIVTPATAGPFTLAGLTGTGSQGDGSVVIRASLAIDPQTAAITVKTAALPTELDGIPLDIRKVIVDVDREGFIFNPTNCSAMDITGGLESASGATANVSYPFQASDCAKLPFKPTFTALIRARHSKANGEYLHVAITSAFGQASLAKVHVQLPPQLPARLETLKQACTAAQFAKEPAGCPPGSVVGTVTVHTPILSAPLTGPAIFVSHGGAGFPNLDLVLRGDGVTIIQVGNTFISSKRVTTSSFNAIPDVPVSRIDLVLPEGPNSALSAIGDVCAQPLYMPTTITGQNGATLTQRTRVGVEGCKPAVTVLRKRATGNVAHLLLHVPSAGTLLASGPDVASVRRHARKAGDISIAVRLSGHDRTVLAHHPGRRVRARVRLRFQPHRGPTISTSVTVLLG